MLLQEGGQSDGEVPRSALLSHAHCSGGRRGGGVGCIAGEWLQDLELDSDYLKLFQDPDFRRFFTSFGL